METRKLIVEMSSNFDTIPVNVGSFQKSYGYFISGVRLLNHVRIVKVSYEQCMYANTTMIL